MRTVIVVWKREALRWGDLLLSDDLADHILDIPSVEILDEELIWLNLVLEAHWSILRGGVNQLVISRIWTQIILVYESANLVCSLKISLVSTIINVLAITIIAVIII
jgi:hypothetical protein